ncbi:MAG: UDP-N-acetylmuramoyl-tripeptide--D-alanyl-D-alanine ligase [SAR324 cluster bacterium]|nr:UDP-N-acetylmuramoyl-tripeptide--D-alanyl-D-alanine ligase [SAR324 cluster bacterium]
MASIINILLTYKKAAEVTAGQWVTTPNDEMLSLSGAAFDSRQLGEAEIFFTLEGARDAHDFLPSLVGSNIKLVVVTKDVPALKGMAILKVTDSLKALQDLASHQAQQAQAKIIAITGSSGKTTAKAWLNYLLSPHFKVQASPGSFNNHIGCPVTILDLEQDTEILILEMGTNGLGELDLLSSIGLADFTLLLNVGHAHVGKFGSFENTYKAKLEIFNHQKAGALSIVPHFDPKILDQTQHLKPITFGAGGDYSAVVLATENYSQTLELTTPKVKYQFTLNQLGEYVGSTFAALAVILEHFGVLGLTLQTLKLPQEKGRSTLLKSGLGATLLDDTYNANPESVINMLTTLASLSEETKVGVIGNLGELDEDLATTASLIVDNIPAGITHLFFTGASGELLAPLVVAKYPDITTEFCPSLKNLFQKIEPLNREGVAIGVKGSRAAHLERIILLLGGRQINCLVESCFHLKNCGSCGEL